MLKRLHPLPIEHSVNLEENYNDLFMILDKIKYQGHAV